MKFVGKENTPVELICIHYEEKEGTIYQTTRYADNTYPDNTIIRTKEEFLESLKMLIESELWDIHLS